MQGGGCRMPRRPYRGREMHHPFGILSTGNLSPGCIRNATTAPTPAS